MNPEQQYENLQYYVQSSPARITATAPDITSLQPFHTDYDPIYRYQPYYAYNPSGNCIGTPVVAQPATALYNNDFATSDFISVGVVHQLPPRSTEEFRPNASAVSNQRSTSGGLVLVKQEKELSDVKDGQFLRSRFTKIGDCL